jgi:hypothetical protein
MDAATAATKTPGGGAQRVMATLVGADEGARADHTAAGEGGGSSHRSKRRVCNLRISKMWCGLFTWCVQVGKQGTLHQEAAGYAGLEAAAPASPGQQLVLHTGTAPCRHRNKNCINKF